MENPGLSPAEFEEVTTIAYYVIATTGKQWKAGFRRPISGLFCIQLLQSLPTERRNPVCEKETTFSSFFLVIETRLYIYFIVECHA